MLARHWLSALFARGILFLKSLQFTRKLKPPFHHFLYFDVTFVDSAQISLLTLCEDSPELGCECAKCKQRADCQGYPDCIKRSSYWYQDNSDYKTSNIKCGINKNNVARLH